MRLNNQSPVVAVGQLRARKPCASCSEHAAVNYPDDLTANPPGDVDAMFMVTNDAVPSLNRWRSEDQHAGHGHSGVVRPSSGRTLGSEPVVHAATALLNAPVMTALLRDGSARPRGRRRREISPACWATLSLRRPPPGGEPGFQVAIATLSACTALALVATTAVCHRQPGDPSNMTGRTATRPSVVTGTAARRVGVPATMSADVVLPVVRRGREAQTWHGSAAGPVSQRVTEGGRPRGVLEPSQ